jgi:hypothetical protein
VEFVWMMPAMVLELAGIIVCLAVRPSLCHEVSLVELVEQDVRALNLFEVIVDPHFVVRHELIDVIMSSFGKINIKHAPDETAIYDPDIHSRLECFPEFDVHLGRISEATTILDPLDVTGLFTLRSLLFIGRFKRVVIGDSLLHQFIFNEKMINEELLFVLRRFVVEPKLVLRNALESVVLSVVSEFFVEVCSDIRAIDNPNSDIPTLAHLFDIGRFELVLHRSTIF